MPSSALDLPGTTVPSAPRPRASRRWLLRGVPLGLSLALHAGLIVLAGGVAWQLAGPSPEPEATEAFIDVPTGIAPRIPVPSRPEPANRASPSPSAAPAGRALADPPAEPASRAGRVEIEPRPEPASPAAGTVASTLDTTDATPVAFAGLSAKRASSVVFVIDGSAPMVGVLPRVLEAVRQSAAALLPAQQFGVVVFHDDSAEAFAPRLVDASPRNQARLTDWLARIEPRGPSTPLAGLRAALAMTPRPRVVFLLSRSIARSHGGQWDEGLRATLDELDALNPADRRTGQRPTVIKTIQFLEPDPTGTMQAIAERHGGGGTTPDYRVLQAEELPR